MGVLFLSVHPSVFSVQLDVGDLKQQLARSQTLFPENPSVWVKDLAGYLNLNLTASESEPTLSSYAHGRSNSDLFVQQEGEDNIVHIQNGPFGHISTICMKKAKCPQLKVPAGQRRIVMTLFCLFVPRLPILPFRKRAEGRDQRPHWTLQ